MTAHSCVSWWRHPDGVFRCRECGAAEVVKVMPTEPRLPRMRRGAPGEFVRDWLNEYVDEWNAALDRFEAAATKEASDLSEPKRDALFVKCQYAKQLIDELPNKGLVGLLVRDDVVRVTSPHADDPAFDDDPETLWDELSWHADRFGMWGAAIQPEDWIPPAEDSTKENK